MPTLLRYEVSLFRAALALNFPRFRDWLLLAAFVAVVALAIARAAGAGVLANPWFAAALGAGAGFAAHRRALQRIAFLATESLVAPAALRRAEHHAYAAAVSVLLLISVAFLALLRAGPIGGGAMAIAVLGGGLLAWLIPYPLRVASRRLGDTTGPRVHSPAQAVCSAQSPLSGGKQRLLFMILVLLPVTVALLQPSSLAEIARIGAPALAMASGTWLLVRVDFMTVRYLSISGFAPGASGWLHLRSAALHAALALPMLALIQPGAALVGGGLSALAAANALLRVWLYRCYGPARADMTLNFGLVGTIALAFAFPPAIPVLLLAAGVWVYRRTRPVTWYLP